MRADIRKEIGGIAEFIGVPPLSDGQMEDLVENTSLKRMRNAAEDRTVGSPPEEKEMAKSFFRTGAVGNWREFFTPEMSDNWDDWIADSLRGTDIRFSRTEQ